MEYRIVADGSSVRVGSRSTMGVITFESHAVTGSITVDVVDGRLDPDSSPAGSLDVDLRELRSGNDLYDAELHRRIDVARHPVCHVRLVRARLLGMRRFALEGELTVHGSTRSIEGSVEVEVPDEHRLLVVGEKTIDMRDFGLPAPNIMLLKIYPDVRVQMFLEATTTPDPAS